MSLRKIMMAARAAKARAAEKAALLHSEGGNYVTDELFDGDSPRGDSLRWGAGAEQPTGMLCSMWVPARLDIQDADKSSTSGLE